MTVDLTIKEALTIFATPLLTLGGGLFAFFKWRHESGEQRALRERELRWRQANSAKQILDELVEAPLAQDALQMLDWNGLEYEVTPGKKQAISEPDYIRALRVIDLRFDDTEAYIRHSFDGLFYFMAILEHQLTTGLVLFEDVRFPLDYYMPDINRNRATFDAFLEHYRLTLSRRFLARMDRELGGAALARPSWDEGPRAIGQAASESVG